MRAFSLLGVLIIFLGAGLSGCEPVDDEGGDGGRAPDGRAPDSAPAASYKWIAIFDETTTPSVPMCAATSGPGADIDSVDLLRGGSVIGVGLRGSAVFSQARTDVSVSPCTGCGSQMRPCTHSDATQAFYAEGIQDARTMLEGTDMGYISLNTGVIWLKIGQANGNAPEQEIRSGDTVIVREVDKWYLANGDAYAGCECPAEKYSVYAYVEMGNASTRVQLRASRYRVENVMECGASPGTSSLGCGTTDFTVP
jgi:hypothetical protein